MFILLYFHQKWNKQKNGCTPKSVQDPKPNQMAVFNRQATVVQQSSSPVRRPSRPQLEVCSGRAQIFLITTGPKLAARPRPVQNVLHYFCNCTNVAHSSIPQSMVAQLGIGCPDPYLVTELRSEPRPRLTRVCSPEPGQSARPENF